MRGQAASQHFAPRGQGYYDAFACQPDQLILASQVGPCTPIEGFTRFNVTGTSGVTGLSYEKITGVGSLLQSGLDDNTMLLVFNPGSSDHIVANLFRLGVNPTDSSKATVVKEEFGITAFNELGPTHTDAFFTIDKKDGDQYTTEGPDGRIESIPLRGSLRIRNITENLAVGGEIRILRYNGGLALGHDTHNQDQLNFTEMGVEEYLNICDMIRDTKRTHNLDGHEVKASHQSNTYPADFVRSMSFEEDRSFYEAVRMPAFCTLLILFDNFKASGSQVNNSYSVGVNVQRAARFRPGTLLHSKAVVPNSHQPTHAAHARAEAAKPAVSPLDKLMDMGANFMQEHGMSALERAAGYGFRKYGKPLLKQYGPSVATFMASRI